MKIGNNPFAKLGSTTIQKQAVSTHQESQSHKLAIAKQKLVSGVNMKAMEKHVELMVDNGKCRIISLMQVMYHTVKLNLSLKKYERLCAFNMYIGTPNMPLSLEYSAYVNATSEKDFISAIYLVYLEKLKQSLLESPFYAILVDESTDRRYEKHLIIYISFLVQGGSSACVTKFVKLVGVKDGKAKSMYEGMKEVLDVLGLSSSKMVAMGSDGAATMLGSKTGLISRICEDVPHVLGVYCIAHREALVVKNTCEFYAEFKVVDTFANKVREWIGDSTIRRNELKKLMDEFFPKHYEILRIHGVRWLSRGQVMQRLAKVMPILLECWRVKYPTMYKKGTSFQLFIVHFLADVLREVNLLNMKFQEDHVDISVIGKEIDVLVILLKNRYLSSNVFAEGSKYLSEFLKVGKNGIFSCKKKVGSMHHHALHYSSLLQDGQSTNMDDCIALAQSYVKRLISNFEDRYSDHHIFNVAKLFSPKNYSKDLEIRASNAHQYLNQLSSKFGALIDTRCYEGELQRFVLELAKAYPTKGLLEAWEQCGSEKEWKEMFPSLYRLWQIIVLLPASIAICERGFSKQNKIKNNERCCLTLETLDVLMFLSLRAPKHISEIDWDLVYDVWKDMKGRRPQSLQEALVEV